MRIRSRNIGEPSSMKGGTHGSYPLAHRCKCSHCTAFKNAQGRESSRPLTLDSSRDAVERQREAVRLRRAEVNNRFNARSAELEANHRDALNREHENQPTLPTHVAGMTPWTDHHKWPAVASFEDVQHVNEDWDTSMDVLWNPTLRDAEFHLVKDFDLSRAANAIEPWEYVSELDWDEDDDPEEYREELEGLADIMEQNPTSVPPIVVGVTAEGKARILDGNHRASLALSRGVTSAPAYVVHMKNDLPGVS